MHSIRAFTELEPSRYKTLPTAGKSNGAKANPGSTACALSNAR